MNPWQIRCERIQTDLEPLGRKASESVEHAPHLHGVSIPIAVNVRIPVAKRWPSRNNESRVPPPLDEEVASRTYCRRLCVAWAGSSVGLAVSGGPTCCVDGVDGLCAGGAADSPLWRVYGGRVTPCEDCGDAFSVLDGMLLADACSAVVAGSDGCCGPSVLGAAVAVHGVSP